MKALTPREVQLGELEILKKLDEICHKLELRYFLTFGTLLGAVRHQGFIPWDDDIDVMMPRPDYEKLMEHLIANEKDYAPLKIMSYRTNKEYIYPIARLCDTRYYVDYEGTVEYGLGLFVDIYPLDGCGNSLEEAKKIRKKNRLMTQCVHQAGMNKFRKSEQAWWRTPAKFAMYCYAKLRGAYYFAKKLDAAGQKYGYDDNKFVNLTIWDTCVLAYPREIFETSQLMQFEDAQLAVPGGYDEILRLCYGDYMKLPPEKDRIAHHYYTAYLKDQD